MPTPAEIRAEIKRLYYNTTRTTAERDLQRAIALLKQLDGETERARVAVYMDGLSQMRSEWILAQRQAARKTTGGTGKRRSRKTGRTAG